MRIEEFAIQLYSLREETAGLGFPAVLEKLGAIGYSGVEFAGCGGLSAAEMRSLLQKNNLTPVGAHIGLDRLETAFEEEIAYHKTLGTRVITVPWAAFGTPGEIQQSAARLSAAGRQVRAAGFQFSYHNHDQEFEKDSDLYRLESMMELAPEVDLQLDLYWAALKGCDCAAFIGKHASRVASLHIKQMDKSGECVDLDDGTLDFSPIIRTALQNGIQTFIHEQEAFSGDPFEGLAKGFRYIKSLSL